MKVCDGKSVGVIPIAGPRGNEEVLVFDRATFPPGVACPAGHVDDHLLDTTAGGPPLPPAERYRAAGVQELFEEVGIRVNAWELKYLGGWFRPGRCRRTLGAMQADVPGHDWRVYTVNVPRDIPLSPSARETRNARWVKASELQRLSLRTLARATGELSAAEFELVPGVEPVWAQWYVEARLVFLDRPDLALIDRLAMQPPPVTA